MNVNLKNVSDKYVFRCISRRGRRWRGGRKAVAAGNGVGRAPRNPGSATHRHNLVASQYSVFKGIAAK